jgi:hypothetical protein
MKIQLRNQLIVITQKGFHREHIVKVEKKNKSIYTKKHA